MTAYVVTVRDAALPDREGLLYPLLRRWQGGSYTASVFSLPALQALIDWKWNRYCRRVRGPGEPLSVSSGVFDAMVTCPVDLLEGRSVVLKPYHSLPCSHR